MAGKGAKAPLGKHSPQAGIYSQQGNVLFPAWEYLLLVSLPNSSVWITQLKRLRFFDKRSVGQRPSDYLRSFLRHFCSKRQSREIGYRLSVIGCCRRTSAFTHQPSLFIVAMMPKKQRRCFVHPTPMFRPNNAVVLHLPYDVSVTDTTSSVTSVTPSVTRQYFECQPIT